MRTLIDENPHMLNHLHHDEPIATNGRTFPALSQLAPNPAGPSWDSHRSPAGYLSPVSIERIHRVITTREGPLP
jgi:hypothetical protein